MMAHLSRLNCENSYTPADPPGQQYTGIFIFYKS